VRADVVGTSLATRGIILFPDESRITDTMTLTVEVFGQTITREIESDGERPDAGLGP
jgi:hypothetical protein